MYNPEGIECHVEYINWILPTLYPSKSLDPEENADINKIYTDGSQQGELVGCTFAIFRRNQLNDKKIYQSQNYTVK